MNEMPRRNRMDKWTVGERAIYDAVQGVEQMGADTRLTNAVILLGQARDAVADFVDMVPMKPPQPSILLTHTEADEIRQALTVLVKAAGGPTMQGIGRLVQSLKMFAPEGRYGNGADALSGAGVPSNGASGGAVGPVRPVGGGDGVNIDQRIAVGVDAQLRAAWRDVGHRSDTHRSERQLGPRPEPNDRNNQLLTFEATIAMLTKERDEARAERDRVKTEYDIYRVGIRSMIQSCTRQ